MLRQYLKSKIHRAVITQADIEYEGSIELPGNLMDEVDLVEGEKVLVASVTSGNRLETYAQRGADGTDFIINGGAAHRIKKGERVTIMAWGLSEGPVVARRIVMNEKNEVVARSGPENPRERVPYGESQ
ncbi:aspartate 1-decarboxylase [Roseibacillus ishigakijimensis]|uniref:Aspartate 1-decarboxylase n=1 Tax=Roseibacillus ishigakijimensis TaxID=454146 RepID=A0A934RRZ2_9BACT|nr:aspartate 1-decarboxylase [Roseibacillus ishigakijimensis]MBK1833934.1 aspartate 1-decarboxylase [Roseibacillus ishigakijimensis]